MAMSSGTTSLLPYSATGTSVKTAMDALVTNNALGNVSVVRDRFVCMDETVRTNPYWQLPASFYAKCGCSDTRPRMLSKQLWQKKYGDRNFAGAK